MQIDVRIKAGARPEKFACEGRARSATASKNDRRTPSHANHLSTDSLVFDRESTFARAFVTAL